MRYMRALIRIVLPQRWQVRLKLALQDFDRTPPILIYQMGKVGSAAVYESLRKANIPNPIYHVHLLSYSNLDEVEHYLKKVGSKTDIISLRYWRAIRRKLDRTKTTKYLISLVRDPVAREISNVFQNMHFHKDLKTDTGGVNIEKTVNHLYEYFANYDEKTDYVCTWFDKEILDSFNIDVYASPFDQSRAYSIIGNDQAKLLLLRMENLSEVFSEAMQEFMGLSVQLVRSNESSSKEYYEAYKTVSKRIILPKETCEKIYSTRFFRHFYSDELRSEYTKKWTSTD